jgi:hypothetical protein
MHSVRSVRSVRPERTESSGRTPSPQRASVRRTPGGMGGFRTTPLGRAAAEIRAFPEATAPGSPDRAKSAIPRQALERIPAATAPQWHESTVFQPNPATSRSSSGTRGPKGGR